MHPSLRLAGMHGWLTRTCEKRDFANHHSSSKEDGSRSGAEVLKVGIVLHTHPHGRQRQRQIAEAVGVVAAWRGVRVVVSVAAASL